MSKEVILRVLRFLARCSDRVIRDHAHGILVRLMMAEEGTIDAIISNEETL